jgi:hypothetical protein
VVTLGEYLSARYLQDAVLWVVADDGVQIFRAQRKHDSAYVPPVDRTCTHWARLRARVKRAAPQKLPVEALARDSHDVRLGVTGAVAPGHDGVLAFDYDVAVGVD